MSGVGALERVCNVLQSDLGILTTPALTMQESRICDACHSHDPIECCSNRQMRRIGIKDLDRARMTTPAVVADALHCLAGNDYDPDLIRKALAHLTLYGKVKPDV